jgi:hypothetical protein
MGFGELEDLEKGGYTIQMLFIPEYGAINHGK